MVEPLLCRTPVVANAMIDDKTEIACLRAASVFITEESIARLMQVEQRITKIAQRGGKMTQRDVNIIHNHVGFVLRDLKEGYAHKTGKWL